VAALPPTSTTARPPATFSPAETNVADQLYKRALKDYQEKNYEAAVVNFKQYLKQAPKSPQAGSAQYMIGESLYAQKQYEAAIVAFDEVVQKHSQDPKVAAAMLKQGYAFAELKDTRNARFFFQQVQKKYPNSAEAQQAAEKLKQLR
jgi:tol-pal system protein YbgF